ncbi:MAG: hypothetical protein R3E86_02320 [Pseudomonadales bacterium]
MARSKANLDWLEQARAALNADPEFRRLGTADFKLGLVVGDAARLISFDAFEISDVVEADPGDMRDADIVLRMSTRDWNAYLRRRGRGKGESLLTLDLESGVVAAKNPVKRLMFERYNRSLQALIDKGAALSA